MAARRGIRIMPVLLGSPDWAASDSRWPPNSSFARAAFDDFAAAVTLRYGPNGSFWKNADGTSKTYAPSAVRTRYLQIWNEPNLGNYWNNRPNPAQYASMVSAASDKANAADPAIQIITAGLPWGSGMSPESFVRGMYAWNRGAVGTKFTAVAIHAYARNPDLFLQGLRSMRSALRAISRSAGARQLWITEMGWATGRPDGRFQVSEKTQASYLKSAYDRLIAVRRDSRYRVGRAFWFNQIDVAGGHWYRKTGLFRRDGSGKPAWKSFRQVTGAG